MGDTSCVFCQIVAGKIPCHKIWEDEKHLAFLSIFPNTKGFSVVIPKKHYSSYFADQDKQVIGELMIASRRVSKLLDNYFADVGRTGLIFEGFGVDHLHCKLFPMHGTVDDEWKKRSSGTEQYFEKYPGYIASNDGKRADDEELARLAKKIRDSYQDRKH